MLAACSLIVAVGNFTPKFVLMTYIFHFYCTHCIRSAVRFHHCCTCYCYCQENILRQFGSAAQNINLTLAVIGDLNGVTP